MKYFELVALFQNKHFTGFLTYKSEEAAINYYYENNKLESLGYTSFEYFLDRQNGSDYTRQISVNHRGEFTDAALDYFYSTGGIPKNQTYDFWIQAGIRWLFEKRKISNNWESAIIKYNGQSSYKDSVLNWYNQAKCNDKNGKSYHIRECDKRGASKAKLALIAKRSDCNCK